MFNEKRELVRSDYGKPPRIPGTLDTTESLVLLGLSFRNDTCAN